MKYGLFILIILLSCTGADNENISGSGVFEGTEVIVSAQVPGQIVETHFEQGDEVVIGDTLATIDMEKLFIQKEQIAAGLDEIDFNIQSAVEAVEQAREKNINISKRFTRIKALFAQASVTQQQMDDIETQYSASKSALSRATASLNAVKMKKRQIEANLKLTETNIQDGTITAPAAGVIIDQFIEPGEIAGIGSPLFSIVDLSDLWIKLYIMETDLGRAKIGDRASIKIDSFPDKTFEGKVVWISPKAEFTPKNVQTRKARADLVYAVKIDVKNPEGILKIGMPADINLEGE